ncbi:MAG: hypothetical protein K1X36_03430 [Pyrinomonadaceae bacterium]|nr:hypothetical protein [Pyrinomonadaceae bacterium]
MKSYKYCVSLVILSSVIIVTASNVLGQRYSLASDLTAVGALQTAGCNDGWDTTFTTNGADDQVNAIAADGNGNIYFAGEFNSIQGMPANGIAKWNGSSWSALGNGINGDIFAIAVSGNDVYVGGSFNVAVSDGMARNVAKWDGTSWTRLGNGLGGGTHIVRSIAVYGSDVFIGGSFSVSDGSPANGIVRWDGSAYSALSLASGEIRSLVVSGGALYAGGNVALAPGPSVGIVKWDGSAWSSLGTAANTTVTTIAVSGTDIYVGGSIILTGQQNSHVAKFDGTAWTRLGFFSNGIVNAVSFFNGELYVGGYLPDPPNTFNHLAKWNGSTWTGVGTGVSGGTSVSETVMSLASINGTLYVGGNFTSANGMGARNMAKYASGTWSSFAGTGLDSSANAIAVSGTDIYVGGTFTSAGSVTANKIAKWNSLTNGWTALGTGVATANTSINAIAVAGDKVFAGGNFTTIGGVGANNIAVWNGTAWSALGAGLNAPVTAIIVRGEDVYVGGSFTTAGGVAANRVAKWNGNSWSGLDSAVLPNTVVSMSFMGNDLYVGIPTTTVANPAYFSKYDGTTWTQLGADLGDRGVSSVAVLGSDVYVAGGFASINGTTVNRVAKWNGSTWSALGGGLPSPTGQLSGVKLATAGNELIAIGDFTVAGGGPADRIARWNGTAWSPLGTGLNGDGSAVVSAGGDILVGGGFMTAGCNASPYFARFRNTVWTAASNSDWHTIGNWSNGSIPPANGTATIVSGDAVISSADVTLNDLVVTGGRTLTIASGRTLTVNGRLDLTNGTLAGPGSVIVNGGLNLTEGNIVGLAALTVNGSLVLAGSGIGGVGLVNLTDCRTTALSGGGTSTFINAPFRRCIDRSGVYRFPVGSNGLYVPVELSNAVGGGTFTVEPKNGAYSGAAVGLPSNRLQRWWNTNAAGVTQADLAFNYQDSEVVGTEGRYRAFRIAGGNSQLLPSTTVIATNRTTVQGVTSFVSFTLAEGPATFETLKGRIRTPRNLGADRVLVSLTDGLGNVRYAMTNNFGYYRFVNVETWKPYMIRLQSKKYSFSTTELLVNFIESNPDINFVSTDH